jgi:hypothetical protein
MAANHVLPEPPVPGGTLAARLERGELLTYAVCPFALPDGDDRRFLLEQRLAGWSHKNISYNPHTGRVTGFRRQSADQAGRLRELLAAFSRAATAWLAGALPGYARAWRLDRASFRPEEEATRRLRLTARNDLLHVDAFPNRPSHGDRLLRLFCNLHPAEPRVWVTSEPFARLLQRYGAAAGLPGRPGPGWDPGLGPGGLVLFHPGRPRRSAYDAFMLRFHHFLKKNEEFQERSRKRVWVFPPGSAWLAFTDGVSHAALRGRFALEHSYFIAPAALVLPAEAPAALLERACGLPVRDRAA